jgi:hypothetical protein
MLIGFYSINNMLFSEAWQSYKKSLLLMNINKLSVKTLELAITGSLVSNMLLKHKNWDETKRKKNI